MFFWLVLGILIGVTGNVLWRWVTNDPWLEAEDIVRVGIVVIAWVVFVCLFCLGWL